MMSHSRFEKSFEELVAQAESDLLACSSFYPMYKNSPEKVLLDLAGTFLGKFRHDRLLAQQSLQHESRNTRLAALLVITDYWPFDRQAARDCATLAFLDDDPVIRGICMTIITVRPSFPNVVLDAFPDVAKRVVLNFSQLPIVKELKSDLKQTAFRLREEVEKIEEKRLAAMWGRWQDMAKEIFPDLIKSYNNTLQYLSHSDPNIRIVALEVAHQHWKRDGQLASECEKMFFGDSDESVRHKALSVISSLYRNSQNHRIGKMLSSVVKNESMSVRLRTRAYEGLFLVRYMPLETWPTNKIQLGQFRFPEYVDWLFVDTF